MRPLVNRAPRSLPSGHVVAERFEVLEVLGQGSASTVYRVRDLHVDSEHEIVALKILHPELHSDRQISGRLRREAAIIGKLTGPHLCPLLELIEEDGQLMLSLEYIDGVGLDTLLSERDALTHEEVSLITEQICEALEVAHAAGVIHRDLKPSNVMIEGEVRSEPAAGEASLNVRVVDFGLAKVIRGDATGTALTEQDMVFGTPNYMSPEQVSGDELDERTDVYACAAMVFEMLVGEPVYDTPGPLTTMAAHANQPVPRPSERAADGALGRSFPARVDGVLMKALAKEPDARHPTARAFAQALSRALRDEPGEQEAVESLTIDIGDTLLDSGDSVSTTLPSHQAEGDDQPVGRGASVRVEVTEARVSSRQPPPPASVDEGDQERKLWWGIAIAAALLAVALGIALGIN